MFTNLRLFIFNLTRVSGIVGMFFLFGAMLITGIDVVMRKVSADGIFGSVDIVQLAILSAAYLSIPHAFMHCSHVSVSILVDHFPRRVACACQFLGAALASAFMSAIAFHGYSQAVQQVKYGDISMNLGIPIIYYWMPLLFGAGLSILVTVYIALEGLLEAITGRSCPALVEKETPK